LSENIEKHITQRAHTHDFMGEKAPKGVSRVEIPLPKKKRIWPFKGSIKKFALFANASKKLSTGSKFAIATSQAQKLGHSDFSEGSEGQKKRDEIAEALARKHKITK